MPRPSLTIGEIRMSITSDAQRQTSALLEIARQLRIKNRLEEFRLRKEYSSAENDPIIDKIMEGEK